jgi:hypothetical protein
MSVDPDVAELIEQINAFSVSDRLKREASMFAKAWLGIVEDATVSVSQIVDSIQLEWKKSTKSLAISFLTGLPPRQMYFQRVDLTLDEPAETALRISLSDEDAIRASIEWLISP